MIETEIRATVRCDHMQWDSAVLKAGWRMCSAVAGSLGCLASCGPYRSAETARQSAAAAGWLVMPLPQPKPNETATILAYCPLHRAEARQFWGETP